ncbi:MAG: T9SS type A sorting domain-containing protein [Candidatus Krumholzibacteriota bacterium]|nr:T9SS type A sorting domain-containing protein [Candidatus Krumholzibacteriota bacterium]
MKKLIALLALGVLLTAGAAHGQLLTTCYDLNGGVVPEDTQVRLEGLIVTGVTGYGFYAQEEAGGEYSGVWIYTSTAEPPSVLLGNLVNVEGLYYEYYGFTEVDASSAYDGIVEIVGAGYYPEPVLVRAWQIKTANPVEAEKWESVLVKCLNLDPLDLDPGYGEWFAVEFGYADNDTVRLDDEMDYGQPLPGMTMESVTGTLRYNYDDFKLEPRGNYDLVFTGADPAPAIDWACATGDATVDVKFDRDVEETTAENPFNYFLDQGIVIAAERDDDLLYMVHLTLDGPMTPEVLLTLTVFDVQNLSGIPMAPQDEQFWGGINTVAFVQQPEAAGDSSAIAGQVATITGVIQSKYDVYGSHVYIQDVGGGLYSGIEVYCPAYLDTLELGDIIVVGDMVSEYYNMTSMTQPFYHFAKVSSGNPTLPPVELTIDGSDLEEYEGMLCAVNEAAVVERGTFENFYVWSISQDGLNWLHVGDMGVYTYQEILGDTLNVRGTIRFEFDEWHIQPRDDDDIDILFDNPPTGTELPAGAGTLLGQNYPNPFNPTTKIAFRLAETGPALLQVFDAQGRLVHTLHEGVLDAGEHSVIWRGDTDTGEPAASGIYFYRLTTALENQTHKMLLVK